MLPEAARRAAALCLLALAAALVSAAGLPERRHFTGQFIPSIGYVAPEIDAFAPHFTLPAPNGTTISAPQPGVTLLVNFWATWCAPCEVELPILQRLDAERDDVAVIAVNMGEPAAHVTAWLAARGIDLPVALDEALDITRLYRVRGQPSTYIIRPDGRIAHIIFGAAAESTLRAALPQ